MSSRQQADIPELHRSAWATGPVQRQVRKLLRWIGRVRCGPTTRIAVLGTALQRQAPRRGIENSAGLPNPRQGVEVGVGAGQLRRSRESPVRVVSVHRWKGCPTVASGPAELLVVGLVAGSLHSPHLLTSRLRHPSRVVGRCGRGTVIRTHQEVLRDPSSDSFTDLGGRATGLGDSAAGDQVPSPSRPLNIACARRAISVYRFSNSRNGCHLCVRSADRCKAKSCCLTVCPHR